MSNTLGEKNYEQFKRLSLFSSHEYLKRSPQWTKDFRNLIPCLNLPLVKLD